MKEDLKLRCSTCGNVLKDIRFKMIVRSTGQVKNLCAFCTEEELKKLKQTQTNRFNLVGVGNISND